MDIYKKIEEIRQKPEHIRMRYVWASVAISMVFILFIWFLSIGLNSSSSTNAAKDDSKLDIYKEIQGQKQNLDQYKDNFNDVKNSLKNINSGYPQN